MADTKITALTALTAADPANDVIPIVDVSDTSMAASGTTKKISVNNILGASGTATLASATITGDLTVRTNKLAVTSTGVGIGTASPTSGTLTVQTHYLLFPDSQTKIGDNGFCNGAASDGNSQIQFFGGKSLFFNEGASNTKMTLNATGLGIGASPTAKLDVAGNAALTGTSGFKYLYFNLATDTNSVRGAKIGKNYDSTFDLNIHATTAASGASNEAAINFYRNNTDISMTLDTSGRLLVGTTSALAAWATRLTLSTDAGTTKWAVGPYAAATNFIISADGGYGVYLNGTTATSWTGISDERLKDIIEPISNAVAKVGQLRSVIGKFKSDETNTRRSFLIAQDVQAVLPEAVDASNPDRLGVAYTEVIPLLVAAIKELTARVQTLETR